MLYKDKANNKIKQEDLSSFEASLQSGSLVVNLKKNPADLQGGFFLTV